MDFLARSMPFLRTRFDSNMKFGRASVPEILGDKWPAAQRLSASWLESTVFLNRGDRFEVRVLPADAQMSPAFAVCAQDFDGDGRQDLFLSQNFFSTQPEIPRLDAGRGLLLRGDGRGGFQPVPGQQSGLLIYGEQRGAAAADFDRDGRVDIVVTQNGAETKLYRNATAKPGLRVRLSSGAGNRDAVGAVLWLEQGGVRGPASEVHAGSGYWSHDSVMQVMAWRDGPGRLMVRWPGRGATTNDIPSGAREVLVEAGGKLSVVR